MATTRAITDDGSVWVTTFFGGAQRGRCFTITQVLDDSRIEVTVTDKQLRGLLLEHGVAVQDSGHRPEMI